MRSSHIPSKHQQTKRASLKILPQFLRVGWWVMQNHQLFFRDMSVMSSKCDEGRLKSTLTFPWQFFSTFLLFTIVLKRKESKIKVEFILDWIFSTPTKEPQRHNLIQIKIEPESKKANLIQDEWGAQQILLNYSAAEKITRIRNHLNSHVNASFFFGWYRKPVQSLQTWKRNQFHAWESLNIAPRK